MTLTVITHSNTYKLVRNIVTLIYAYLYLLHPVSAILVTDINSVRVNINIQHISQKYCYIYLSEILLHLHIYSVRTYICTGNNRVVMSKSSVRDFVLVTVYIYMLLLPHLLQLQSCACHNSVPMASVRDTITDCYYTDLYW